MQDKKVLIISHNAFSTSNNMGKTLSGLFGGFEKLNLAQLYFHVSDSDIDLCKTSFKITDKDILKSLYTFKAWGKRVEDIREVKYEENELTERVYKFGQKRTAGKHLARDIMWKIGRWKSKELFEWIEEFKPDAIFYAAGYAMFSYNIALFIAKKYKIPLITYFCDDYYDYNYSQNNSIIANIRMKFFRNKVEEIIVESSQLVFISDSMMKKYKEIFNKEGVVVMTPYTSCEQERKVMHNPLKIVYAGSVMSNRWKTLQKIGEALEQINKNKQQIILEIYSQGVEPEIISKLSMGQSMVFKGAVDADKVKMIYKDADILLHIESFLEKDIIRVKHSISTKIADCLASNRVFLAVGPSEIASIEYLEKNNAAYIIKDETQILDKLEYYFIKNEINSNIIDNAYKLSNKNHNKTINMDKIKMIINNLS
ncbi:hypothetical protein GMB50_12540 [Turicibacter sanguinis]|uniref:hypothetical protein n=1 Tax=Turicibacter sanguinis TaxID=154288 RepID=UPI0012BB4F43|nr:hypothetical protein [Turicibacter sanguinis]MDB8545636.1 hypothetical protein [Turicibacter sanguinis]MTO10808.1 hypothetical protein [Turicibacter sanguinis]MTP48343.1 hypothetical protein [Turicibacter sanguinis]MTP51062.1 hypothetical protein [Turicibacter sanguinis]MTQ08344.1 hypothetical protein [Turicibacter sanguinis]